MSDTTKCAVMQSRAPAAVRTHLLLNAATVTDWPSARRVIRNHLIASAGAAPTPMEIGGAMGDHSKGKGGRKGKRRDSNKGVGKQQHKDAAAPKSKGKGKSQNKGQYGPGGEVFTGFCGRCGKKGHKQKDCWSKLVGSLEDHHSGQSAAHSGSSGDDASDTWWQSWSWGEGTWAQEPQQEPSSGTVAAVTKMEAEEEQWVFTLSEQSVASTQPGRVTTSTGSEVDLMVDSGAELTVCGPQDFPDVPTEERGTPARLRSAEGRLLKWYGQKRVSFETQGEKMQVTFDVVDVVRPILSVARMTDHGNEVTLGRNGGEVRRGGRAKRLGLPRRAGLFFLRATVIAVALGTAKTMAPVAGPEFDEGRARELLVNPSPEASPTKPSRDEQEAHELTHTPYARWCTDCVMGRGRDDRHEQNTEQVDGTPVVQIDYTFGKMEPDDPLVPVLWAIDNVYHPPLGRGLVRAQGRR